MPIVRDGRTRSEVTTLLAALSGSLSLKPALRCRAVGHDPQSRTIRVRVATVTEGTSDPLPVDEQIEFHIALCSRCGRADKDSALTLFDTYDPSPTQIAEFEALPW